MRPSLFNRILEGVVAHDDYFVQKHDVVNLLDLSSHQKIVASMQFLVSGASADIWGDYMCMSEETVPETVKKLFYVVIQVFGSRVC